MKVKITIEGKTDISLIEDIFTALETKKINVTKSKKLEEIEEVKTIKQQIKQEVETMLGDKVYIEELIIFKSGLYILKGVLQR